MYGCLTGVSVPWGVMETSVSSSLHRIPSQIVLRLLLLYNTYCPGSRADVLMYVTTRVGARDTGIGRALNPARCESGFTMT
jgi:hypothetical protein